MACINCGCSPPKTGSTYQVCTNAAAQRLPGVPDSVLMNYAATAGARSSDFTMCLAVACLIARRLIYYKCTPGDCGQPGFALTGWSGTEMGVTKGLAVAAAADAEPISKGILSGMAAVFGGFTAAHTAAVQTEQTTLCQVAVNYNQAAQGLEQAVEQGLMLPAQAASVMDQITQELDQVLAGIAKPCNASCGFRITLAALDKYFGEQVYPALAPDISVPLVTPIAAPPPIASPATPGTSGIQGSALATPPPVAISTVAPVLNTPLPPNVGSYVGASGYLATPLNANNTGIGATAGLSLPGNLPVGAIVVIGGIAYIASRPGAVAAAAG